MNDKFAKFLGRAVQLGLTDEEIKEIMETEDKKNWQCGSGHWNIQKDAFCKVCFQPRFDMQPVYP